MVPLDFFEDVEEEEKHDVGDSDEDEMLLGNQVGPTAYELALTQKGRIQFISGGRRYQVKSQKPILCEPGHECVLKLYCSHKGCQVSAYVNRTVPLEVAEPAQAEFTDWRFEPVDRVHVADCLPNLCLNEEVLFRQHILREATNSPALNLTDIYAQALANVTADHRQYMPTETSFQSSFYKHRRLLQQNPQSHETLTDDLVPNVCRGTVYGDVDSDLFYRGISHFNVGDCVHSNMFFFGEDFFVQLMRAPDWAVDGTFRWLPKAFQGRSCQLFVIHFFIGGPEHRRAIPAVYVLCSHHDVASYLNIIGFLHHTAEELNVQHNEDEDWDLLVVDGKTAMMDFELAIHQAFIQALPNTIRRGCDFHRCYATYNHLCELGLRGQYQNPTFLVPSLKDIVGALFALSFVEVPHVVNTFDQIVVHAAPLVANVPRVNSLFAYFRRQWLGFTVALPQGNIDHIALWNFHDDLNERRTNNDVEGWHRVFNSQLRQSRNLWQYIRTLQNEQLKQQTRFAQFLNGQVIARIRDHRQQVKEETLLLLRTQYLQGHYPTRLDYVLRVGKLCYSV
jgi:hypothetical protein